MRHLARFALVLWCFGMTVSGAYALGADYVKGQIVFVPNSEELSTLANLPNRAHGYFLNWTDVFFYEGDTEAFNRFAADYGKLEKTTLRVVLHPGAKRAQSPWDKAERNIPVEWMLTCGGSRNGKKDSHIDLWLGGRVKLEEVRIPDNIEVASGGEIEQFLAKRPKRQTKNPAPDIKALSPAEAVQRMLKTPVTVEFRVETAGWPCAPIPVGEDPLPPIMLDWDGRLPKGGRFYALLTAKAIRQMHASDKDRPGPEFGHLTADTGYVDRLCKRFQGKGIRVTGRLQPPAPGAAPSETYLLVDSAENITILP